MHAQGKTVLNIGCGKTRLPNSIGVDLVHIDGFVDVVHNLDVTPFPFENDFADEIHMYHVLEHLHDPLHKMEELHRILKPGGVLYLRVPHFSSMGAFTDITHIRPFGYLSFDCFEKTIYQHFYTTKEFEILHREIRYLGLYPNSGFYAQYIHGNQCPLIARPFVLALNFLINLKPIFFERFLCYCVGVATELVVTLKKA